MPSLVEVIQLKWLLAGEGVYLHVERLMSDADYANQALARAEASSSAILRQAAARMRSRMESAAA